MSDRSPRSIRATATSVVDALSRAHALATTSFDPNIRPLVTPDRDSVTRLVERQVSFAHVVKASEEDLEWLYPGRAVEDSLAEWARIGPRFCIATLGERGAVAFLGDHRVAVAAPKVDVVDTVGAGDSFMSALLSAMDRDGALGANSSAPDAAPVRALADLRRRRLGDHLHAQGFRSADARRCRGDAAIVNAIGPLTKLAVIAATARQV